MALRSGSRCVSAACQGPLLKLSWGQGLGFSPRTGDRAPRWDSVHCRQGVYQASGSPFPEIIAVATSSLPPPHTREEQGVQAQGGLCTSLPGPSQLQEPGPRLGSEKPMIWQLSKEESALEIPSGERELQKTTCSVFPFV